MEIFIKAYLPHHIVCKVRSPISDINGTALLCLHLPEKNIDSGFDSWFVSPKRCTVIPASVGTKDHAREVAHEVLSQCVGVQDQTFDAEPSIPRSPSATMVIGVPARENGYFSHIAGNLTVKRRFAALRVRSIDKDNRRLMDISRGP